MHLHVFTGNAAAIRFYESIGYAQAGMAKDFYAQNLHALLYRKQLSVQARSSTKESLNKSQF